jgi:hypothetical protein
MSAERPIGGSVYPSYRYLAEGLRGYVAAHLGRRRCNSCTFPNRNGDRDLCGRLRLHTSPVCAGLELRRDRLCADGLRGYHTYVPSELSTLRRSGT